MFGRLLRWSLAPLLLAACAGSGSGADVTPPKIVLKGDNPMTVVLGAAYREPGAYAIDDRDGEVPVTASGEVNTGLAGEYRREYTASDRSGNRARVERRVLVRADPRLRYPPDTLTVDGDLETEGYEGDTSVPRPEPGEWVNEGGKFATRITRVTDAEKTVVKDGEKSPVHHYPKDQAWNSDQTLLVLGGRWLVRADNFERVRRVSSYKRWSHSDPHMRIGLERCGDRGHYCVAREDVETGKITILYEIPGAYERMTLGEYEGNLDFQDRYIILTGRREENSTSEIATLILYDLEHDRAVIKDFDGPEHRLYLTKTYKNDKLDWASITPTGKYVLVHKYADMRSGVATDSKKVVEVYDRDLKYLYTLAYKANHGDICVSADGRRDIYVQFENGGPGAYGHYDPESGEAASGVWAYDLEKRERERLVANHGGGHVSCRNYQRPGWAYISYKKLISKGPHPYLYRDVFAIKLGAEGLRDGERIVERFANARFMRKDNSACGYSYTDLGPHALPSPDGARVIFKSNWSEKGCLDDFLVEARP